MLKLVALVRRADDVTHDHLVEHWRNKHMPTVIEHVRPDKYRVTFFDDADDSPYDGMAALWFEDAERGRRLMTREDAQAVPDDGFNALIRHPAVILACEEHVIVDGPQPADALKVTGLVRRKPGIDADMFYKSWLEDHVPNVASKLQTTPGGLRYVVTHATLGDADPELTGFAEVYYTGADAAREHMGQLGPDNFVKYARASGFLNGHEVVGIE